MMKLSVLKNHPGYDDWAKLVDDGRTAWVYVDGHLVRHCLEASEEEGYARAYQCEPNGSLRLDETKSRPMEVRLEGEVHISVLPATVSAELVPVSYKELLP